MTRHPTARRVHHQGATADDAFVAGVLESTAWAKQHRQKLVIGLIVGAIALAALVLFMNNRSQQAQQAASELTLVRAAALTDNPQSAIPALETYIDRFGGQDIAGEARLLLGRAYLQTGQPQQTIEAVQGLARDLDSEFGPNAAYLVAAAHEAAQEPHRAEEVFLRMGQESEFLYMQQDAFDNVARLRMQRGDYAGAVEMYQRLIDITPETASERQVFQLRLGEATALAATGGPATAAPAAPAAPGTAPADSAPTTGS